jgi:prepilin peptidase CpaA
MSVGSTLLGAVGALLLVACWTDISSLRIPNWISAGIAGLFALFAIGLPLTDTLQHVLAGLLVLVGGLGLFAWGKLGGGDVKLLTATSLWVGWGPMLLDLFLAIGVLGAAISLIVIALRSRIVAGVFHGKGYRPAVLDPNAGAPYAVAIAGGFFLISFVPA